MNRTEEAEDLLRSLGVGGGYRGLKQAAFAVALVMEDRRKLRHITKGLYQETAKEFHTGWKNVEHNIRTVINVIWNQGQKESLIGISRGRLENKPANTEFIDILAVCLMDREKLWEEADEQQYPPSDPRSFNELLTGLIVRVEKLEREIAQMRERAM